MQFNKFFVIISIVCFGCFVSANSLAKNNGNSLPLEDLQRFASVIEHIRKFYVKPVDDQQLFEDAIRGMLSGLDPHSAYLDKEEFSDLKINTTGKFGGLGIEVTMEEGLIKVISPIDDTPAQKAGIMAGDLIIKLDEAQVKGLTLKQAVEKMRGDKGSKINLTVIRKSETKPIQIEITRDIIQVKSVKAKMLDDNFGYVRVSQFQTKTAEDLKKALETLNKQANNNLRGLILDLRNNPGGILETSVKVSDLFIDAKQNQYDNLIVYTEGRLPGSKIKEKAKTTDTLNGAPIVVLVNGGSASASEIVAGALQDHKRALIVGTKTFGKGSVQTVLPLQDNHGLKLTTALYYTPKGRSIQAEGITPDINIPALKIPKPEENDQNWLAIKESDLTGHLENGKSKESKKQSEASAKVTQALILEDYQLHEALNLLRGLALLGPRADIGSLMVHKSRLNKLN